MNSNEQVKLGTNAPGGILTGFGQTSGGLGGGNDPFKKT